MDNIMSSMLKIPDKQNTGQKVSVQLNAQIY